MSQYVVSWVLQCIHTVNMPTCGDIMVKPQEEGTVISLRKIYGILAILKYEHSHVWKTLGNSFRPLVLQYPLYTVAVSRLGNCLRTVAPEQAIWA